MPKTLAGEVATSVVSLGINRPDKTIGYEQRASPVLVMSLYGPIRVLPIYRTELHMKGRRRAEPLYGQNRVVRGESAHPIGSRSGSPPGSVQRQRTPLLIRRDCHGPSPQST
jgi:hypothetical protein